MDAGTKKPNMMPSTPIKCSNCNHKGNKTMELKKHMIYLGAHVSMKSHKPPNYSISTHTTNKHIEKIPLSNL